MRASTHPTASCMKVGPGAATDTTAGRLERALATCRGGALVVAAGSAGGRAAVRGGVGVLMLCLSAVGRVCGTGTATAASASATASALAEAM
jgi:hypothetical protein